MNAQDIIRSIEAEQIKSNLPDIYVGDTVKVGVKIKEGEKYRVQPYEGVVIARRNGGINETITVRKVFQGVGVERVFCCILPGLTASRYYVVVKSAVLSCIIFAIASVRQPGLNNGLTALCNLSFQRMGEISSLKRHLPLTCFSDKIEVRYKSHIALN